MEENTKGGDIVFATGVGKSKIGEPIPQCSGSFIFKFSDGTEFIRADANGDVFVRGTKVDTDRGVYENFREWLNHATFSITATVAQIGQPPLQAWSNGYEVVAAQSEKHARQVLLAAADNGGPDYDIEDINGDGWHVLSDDMNMLDEDSKTLDETVGDIVRRKGRPGHLWSIEP